MEQPTHGRRQRTLSSTGVARVAVPSCGTATVPTAPSSSNTRSRSCSHTHSAVRASLISVGARTKGTAPARTRRGTDFSPPWTTCGCTTPSGLNPAMSNDHTPHQWSYRCELTAITTAVRSNSAHHRPVAVHSGRVSNVASRKSCKRNVSFTLQMLFPGINGGKGMTWHVKSADTTWTRAMGFSHQSSQSLELNENIHTADQENVNVGFELTAATGCPVCGNVSRTGPCFTALTRETCKTQSFVGIAVV